MPDISLSQTTLNTLARVAIAQKTVSAAQTDRSLSDAQKSVLFKMYWDLDDLQQKLIVENLTTQVQQLTADSNDLKNTAQQLQNQATSLNQVAQDVNTAASAVSILVNLLAAVAAAGLV